MIRAAIWVVVSGSAERMRMKEGFDWRRAASRVPEVGVVGDDDSVVAECPVEDLVVGCVLELNVADWNGVVASGSEQSGDVW